MDEIHDRPSRETLLRLVAGHQGLYRSPVVLIEWDQAPGCIWPIRLPEVVGTSAEGYGEYQRYYQWQRASDNRLYFENAPLTDTRFQGVCHGEVQIQADRIEFKLSASNQSEQPWSQFFGHVCLLHMFTDRAHEAGFGGNHYFYDQDGRRHIREVTPEFPELEFAWCAIEGSDEFLDNFKDTGRYLRPGTASIQRLETERIYRNQLQRVTLASEDAVLLGWSGWPCTDLALSFGTVGPGQTQSVTGQVVFSQHEGVRP
jgi:hypothetical protein